MTVIHTATYDACLDGLELLALPSALDARLAAALDHDDPDTRHVISDEVSAAITEQIQLHGVDTNTGEWLGDWSVEAIVTAALGRYAA